MKRRIRFIVWLGCILLSLKVQVYAQRFAGGGGEPNDPYQIATAGQLVSIGSDPNLLDKHFILINDIDLDPNLPGGQVFNQAVIASDSDGESKWPPPFFTGSFDGNGHRIRNLTIHGSTTGNLGLFGGVAGRIHNLGLENVSIIGTNDSRNLGGLAVFLEQGTINNCYTTGNVSGRDNSRGLGGLVGFILHGVSAISNCYTTVNVCGGNNSIGLGGLVGNAQVGRITNCYATGNISSGDSSMVLGGLVGQNGSTISNCYATGSVIAGQDANDLGGLVGDNWGPTLNCYFLTPSDGGGPDNGVGSSLTEKQMKHQASFTNWDFDRVWMIHEGKGFPSLQPEAPEPLKPSPPDLSRCTRIEIRYYPSTLKYVCPTVKDRSLLTHEEIDYLRSLEAIVVDDQERIKVLAHDISLGSYGGTGGSISARPIAVIRYHNGERLTSFTYFILSIKSEEGHLFDYDRRLPSLEKLTPQIRPFRLRLDCADNLRSIHDRLQSYLESEKAYPAATKWNDSIVRFLYEPPSPVTVRVLRCPSAGKGKSHYAINPNCKPDSPPDMVLLFETKGGWNQHGGPKLFTFDNHDPKGGCVLLNDGTVKFIRTKEELQQLRWK